MPRIALALFALLALTPAAHGVEIDLQRQYGVTVRGLQRAINDARQTFLRTPDATVVIRIGEGTFALDDDHARAAIDLSGLVPGGRGRLVIAGAGMDRSRLVVAERLVGVYGRDVHRLVVQDLQFSRPARTVTQGRVTATGPGSVTLEFDRALPTPADLVDPTPLGHWLRRCLPDALSFPADSNLQQAWTAAERTADGRWRFTLQRDATPPWQVGDTLAVKSKHGGNAYWFHGGDDVTFQRVRWLDESRGTFRGGMSGIRILDSRIERVPDAAGHRTCLATPDGGPQIGQPDDPPTTDVLVQGNDFEGTGDDAIALFNASGTVADNHVADSFARGILLNHSEGTVLRGNEVLRSPTLHVRP